MKPGKASSLGRGRGTRRGPPCLHGFGGGGEGGVGPLRLRRTPGGDVRNIRFELFAKPLPESRSPTTSRPGPIPRAATACVSTRASSRRPSSSGRGEKFTPDGGMGTFLPMTLSFDRARIWLRTSARHHLANMKQRSSVDDYDFRERRGLHHHLATGVPVPVDLGEDAFNRRYASSALLSHTILGDRQNSLFETSTRPGRPAPSHEVQPRARTTSTAVARPPNLDYPSRASLPPNGDQRRLDQKLNLCMPTTCSLLRAPADHAHRASAESRSTPR